MTTDIEEFRQGLVAAVQAELERHASAVVAEIDRLRDEAEREREALRAEFSSQVQALQGVVREAEAQRGDERSLADAIEKSQRRTDEQLAKLRAVIDERVGEAESRQTRRVEDTMAGLDGLVQAAVRPLLQDAGDQQEALAHKVDGLDKNLRKFDEQAARMVTYFNDVSQNMETQQTEAIEQLKADVAAQVDTIQKLVEDNESAVRRFQNEVGQTVSQRLGDVEDRFNNRLLGAESRMKEEAGQKIAEIDAHVGRVSSGLDDTMTVLNDRVAGLDERFAAQDRRIEEVAEGIDGIDSDALDELKEKLSSAVGEAMLVRIEMERLEKSVAERTDTLTVRLTEVETSLADATMDVSTAVQLDRLEEIERALIEIDPAKFVLKSEAGQSAVADTTPDQPDAMPDQPEPPSDLGVPKGAPAPLSAPQPPAGQPLAGQPLGVPQDATPVSGVS